MGVTPLHGLIQDFDIEFVDDDLGTFSGISGRLSGALLGADKPRCVFRFAVVAEPSPLFCHLSGCCFWCQFQGRRTRRDPLASM